MATINAIKLFLFGTAKSGLRKVVIENLTCNSQEREKTVLEFDDAKRRSRKNET